MEKGDRAIMVLHLLGEVVEENYEVLDVDGDIVTLYTAIELEDCKKFKMSDGSCINDFTAFGSKHTLKIIDDSD